MFPHRLVLGTATFGDTVDLDTARRMVDVALAAGVTSIDTANGYGKGRSEEMLAEILQGRHRDVTIATKAGIYAGDAGGAPLLSRNGIRASIEASLRRLDMPEVDLYYLHKPDRSVDVAETVAALDELIDEGKIRAIGVSNFSSWQIADVMTACDAVGAPRPAVAQQMYNLVARRIEGEYVEFAQNRQLTTVVYNPLGGGILSGRHRLEEVPDTGRFGSSVLARMYRDRYWNKPVFEAVSALSDIAVAANVTLPTLALRWLLSRPGVDAVLLGGSSTKHIESNIAAAAAGPLTPDVLIACDAVGKALAGPMPEYNR